MYETSIHSESDFSSFYLDYIIKNNNIIKLPYLNLNNFNII